MKNGYPPMPLSDNNLRTPLGPKNGSGIFAQNLFKGCEHGAQGALRANAHVYHTPNVNN
jgi:hypothetical protein